MCPQQNGNEQKTNFIASNSYNLYDIAISHAQMLKPINNAIKTISRSSSSVHLSSCSATGDVTASWRCRRRYDTYLFLLPGGPRQCFRRRFTENSIIVTWKLARAILIFVAILSNMPIEHTLLLSCWRTSLFCLHNSSKLNCFEILIYTKVLFHSEQNFKEFWKQSFPLCTIYCTKYRPTELGEFITRKNRNPPDKQMSSGIDCHLKLWQIFFGYKLFKI